MGQFLSRLHMTQVYEAAETGNGRPLMELDTPLVFDSEIVGKVVAPAGFRTDLASVPRVPLAWWLTGGHGNRAAVIHDWLLEEGIVTRRIADRVFREALQASGTPTWRTWLMYLGVRIGAVFSTSTQAATN
jgi:hypothetical protein